MNNQQSILVNYNPHFANGDASDFVQPFNKQLEIPENAEVAFYQGQLQRKAITLPESETIGIKYVEQLPTDEFRQNVSDGTYAKIDGAGIPSKLFDDTILMNRGSYTQSEFVESFRAELASVVEFNRGQSMANNSGTDFLYQAVGENDGNGIFLGYAPENVPVAIYDTANIGSEVAISNGSFDVGVAQTFKANNTDDNWHQFLTTQFPINPLSAIQNSYSPKQDNNQNVLYFDLDFTPLTNETQRIYVNFANDAFTSNMWSTPYNPLVKHAYPNYSTASEGLPFGFFGIEYKLITDSSNVSTIEGGIYVSDIFSNNEQYRPQNQFPQAYERILKGTENWHDLFNDGKFLQRAYNWKVAGDFIPRQAIRFYSLTEKSGIEDPTGLQTQETRNYYFQLLSKTYNDNGFYGFKGGDNVVFDSKDYGLSLPQRLVEDAAALQSFKSSRDDSKRQFLGIKPYFHMRNVSPSTSIFNPKMTAIAQRSSNNFTVNMFNQPVVRYNYEFPVGSIVRDLLGTGRSYQDITKFDTEEARFDPNIYPQSRGRQAGVNALYSDNQRYNFEIDSLPIRTFNSTKNKNNVSGNERTILHSTESFIDGEITELTNSFLNKNVIPSNLKYISLNNKGRIILNDLSIKITRADTNVIANEITDCSFEMLVRSSVSSRA